MNHKYILFYLTAILLLSCEAYAVDEKVLVIGLDGATLDTLQPWMDAGKLPNLKKLVDGGVLGNLSSVIPYVSPVAWSSFMTGNNPGKHGVYGFQQVKPGLYEPFIPMGNDVHGDTLWRILSDNGKKSIVVNVLLTYPIEDNIDGVVVGGMMAPGVKAKPKKYESFLIDRGYITEGKGFLNTDKDEFLASLYETTDKRVDGTIALMGEIPDWDFTMILISGTDRIQHYMWGDMEDKDPVYGDAILNYYMECDKHVGRLVEKAGPKASVVILSDHGFGRQRKRVHINHFLVDEGFMSLKDSWENTKTLWTIRLSGFLKETGLNEILRSVLVNFFSGEGTETRPPKVVVDYSTKTSVYTPAYYTGHLYMNPKLSTEEYTVKREELIAKLLLLKDPVTGEKIVEHAFRREDIYTGDMVSHAPDVVVVPAGDYWIVGGMNYHKLIEPIYRDTGQHRLHGMMILNGPHFRNSDKLAQADLIDIAPTVLKIYGIKSDMDGRVLEEHLK